MHQKQKEKKDYGIKKNIKRYDTNNCEIFLIIILIFTSHSYSKDADYKEKYNGFVRAMTRSEFDETNIQELYISWVSLTESYVSSEVLGYTC